MKTFVIPILLIFVGIASAAETASRGAVHSITLPAVTTELKTGQGKENTEGYCGVCHSLDYIVMQPPFAKEKWGEIVAKMIKTYGARIPKEAAEEITGYLGAAYGTKKVTGRNIEHAEKRGARDRSAVKRDVDILAAAGLVQVETRLFRGHGRMKFVKVLRKSSN